MEYKTIKILDEWHVVCNTIERPAPHKDANYRNTKMALCGILKPGETLKKFIKKREIQLDNGVKRANKSNINN